MDDEPKMVTVENRQVSGPLLVAVPPFGGVKFSITCVVAFDTVQPFTGLVTVNV